MKKIIVGLGVVLASALLFGTAFADSTHTCQGNSCNGGAGSSATAQANPTIVTGATGGNASAIAGGGQGGAGVGVGSVKVKGGDVKQNVKTSVKQSTKVNTTDVNVVDGAEVKKSGNSTVKIKGDKTDVFVPAAAPALGGYSLTAAPETCMGSFNMQGTASTGLISFGIGGGKTYVDEDCSRRMDARMLMGLGEREVAIELMSEKASVKAAFERVYGKKESKVAPSDAEPKQAAALQGEVTGVSQQVTSTNFGARPESN